MFDNLSKFLADEYSQDLSSWFVGYPVTLTELKPKELSLEPIRADSVVLLKSTDLIIHGEFQTDPDDDIAFRMADYALRIFRKFPNHRLIQVMVYLRRTDSPKVKVTTFRGNNLFHEFRVIRLWEESTAPFLTRPGLWPYAALTNTDDPASVLRAIAQKIDGLNDRRERANLSAVSAVMSALCLEKDTIEQILRRDIMRESAMYQEMQSWARTDAEREVRAEAKREEGQTIALSLLRQGVSYQIITEATGFTIAEIRALEAQL
jgi:predicted transposase/invertase (TIGR01784 family)